MRVSRLVVLILSISLTSCAVKTGSECKPIVEKVPVKCSVPDIPPYELEKIQESDTYEERLRKLISNYGKLREENRILREAIEVCK